jgi:hypothetical protein
LTVLQIKVNIIFALLMLKRSEDAINLLTDFVKEHPIS